MDTFDLKKYLVENKLTYQEKMKAKAKKSMKEAETSTQTRDKERVHQAPKDKSKQGPSLNEAEITDKDIELYIKYSAEYEVAMQQGQRGDADMIDRTMEQMFKGKKGIKNKAVKFCKRTQDKIMKNECDKAKLQESKTLNEGKVFFGEY